jgi:hypothetical protein
MKQTQREGTRILLPCCLIIGGQWEPQNGVLLTWWKPVNRRTVCGTPLLARNFSVQLLMFIRGTSGCLSQLKIEKKMYRWMPIAYSTMAEFKQGEHAELT